MVQFKPYITRVLSVVFKIYPSERTEIEAMMKLYEGQIPLKVTIPQINKALKVVDLIQGALEQLKDDTLDEEEDIESAGIQTL
jgi:hypothetical protein